MRAPASRQAVAERAGRGAPGSNCKPVFARMCQGVAKQAVVAKHKTRGAQKMMGSLNKMTIQKLIRPRFSQLQQHMVNERQQQEQQESLRSKHSDDDKETKEYNIHVQEQSLEELETVKPSDQFDIIHELPQQGHENTEYVKERGMCSLPPYDDSTLLSNDMGTKVQWNEEIKDISKNVLRLSDTLLIQPQPSKDSFIIRPRTDDVALDMQAFKTIKTQEQRPNNEGRFPLQESARKLAAKRTEMKKQDAFWNLYENIHDKKREEGEKKLFNVFNKIVQKVIGN